MKQSAIVAALAFAAAGLQALPVAAAPFKCPHVGGDFTFGQEANINSLDQMTSSTISTRNIAMNMFEALMTRDENFNPILDLAASVTEAPDHLTYTFKLRQGVHFHNGKLMTSADVVASFDRYAKVGLERAMLANVDRWDAPDRGHLRHPHEEGAADVPDRAELVQRADRDHSGGGQGRSATAVEDDRHRDRASWSNAVPGSYVKMKRYDGYTPNTQFEQRTGFGGYKQACFDTVTFRIVTEPGARVAGLKTGELQGVEDIPAKSLPELKGDKNITILPLKNWWIQIAYPNTSVPPTDNLSFRKAVQAALDMDEIMDAASDGNYCAERRLPVSEPGRLHRCRQGDLQHQGSRRWRRSTWRSRATRASRSCC